MRKNCDLLRTGAKLFPSRITSLSSYVCFVCLSSADLCSSFRTCSYILQLFSDLSRAVLSFLHSSSSRLILSHLKGLPQHRRFQSLGKRKGDQDGTRNSKIDPKSRKLRHSLCEICLQTSETYHIYIYIYIHIKRSDAFSCSCTLTLLLNFSVPLLFATWDMPAFFS